MNRDIVLSASQIEDIRSRASKVRRLFGVYEEVPIANDIFVLLERKNIILCEYPFASSGESHTDASLTRFETGDEPIVFIGLNTSLPYDEQIFALAHELYHYTTQTGKSYSDEESEDPVIEKKADRFAAELLLPKSALRNQVIKEFKTDRIEANQERRVLRFIVRLQCEWWLPYHAILNRIYEEGHIGKELFNSLYGIDDRNPNSTYGRLFRAIDKEKYDFLNCRTKRKGVSIAALETIILNYEDGMVSDKEFIELLNLFGKKPEDMGFELVACREDLEELEELFGGDELDEG